MPTCAIVEAASRVGTSFAHATLIADAQDRPADARLLTTLQELVELPALGLAEALTAASQRIAAVLGCDKVDIFLLDEEHQTLQAVGTSRTEMGRRQHALGLDRMALANGGSVVETFRTGRSSLVGHADEDPNELVGVVSGLGARSTLSTALSINGKRRGVLSAVAATPEFFQANDQLLFEALAPCIGLLAERAELAERARVAEAQQARRLGADEIITVLAHDLRNLLHPLVTRLQVMRLKRTQAQSIDVTDVEKALAAVQRLSTMTNHLLDLKRLDEGLFSLAPAPVDLVALTRAVSTSLATPDVGVHVQAPAALVIVGDPERLRQVLENLIANAVKHSPRGQDVEVSVRPGEEGAAVVEVCDRGPGIAPELLPNVFERWTASPRSTGIGLGLYLAQRIACEHGGKLSVESSPGEGTRFRLELPLAGAPADGSELG